MMKCTYQYEFAYESSNFPIVQTPFHILEMGTETVSLRCVLLHDSPTCTLPWMDEVLADSFPKSKCDSRSQDLQYVRLLNASQSHAGFQIFCCMAFVALAYLDRSTSKSSAPVSKVVSCIRRKLLGHDELLLPSPFRSYMKGTFDLQRSFDVGLVLTKQRSSPQLPLDHVTLRMDQWNEVR